MRHACEIQKPFALVLIYVAHMALFRSTALKEEEYPMSQTTQL